MIFNTTLNPNRTVQDFAVTIPNAVKVFENYGIDYCCNAKESLAKACDNVGVNLLEVCNALEKNNVFEAKQFIDWDQKKLSELIDYILNKHHIFTKTELKRLSNLLSKVSDVHEENHPELIKIKALFSLLFQDLADHLMKEEQILFPYIICLEEAVSQREPIPYSCFGSVKNPVQMMMYEHDQAGDLLKELHRLTSNYTTPADGCASYSALFSGLKELESDLHQHIHLENNILFPKAVELERAFCSTLG
jgi:regulator of cell morphogenesis and NO signaling